MAWLTPEQIARLTALLNDAAVALAYRTLGYQLTAEQLQRLADRGILTADATTHDLIAHAFQYGRVLGMRPQDHRPRSWSREKLAEHLKAHPTAPTPTEQAAVAEARTRAGEYCVGLGSRYAPEVAGLAEHLDATLAAEHAAGIKREVAEAVSQRKTAGQLRTALRHIADDYGRDWERIANTEMQLAQQRGFADQLEARHGPEVMVAKIPEPRACEHCRALYLGEDGRPLVRPMTWWRANGDANVGRKQSEWRAVLGAMHPHCFCQLVHVPAGMGFDAKWDLRPLAAISKAEVLEGGRGDGRPDGDFDAEDLAEGVRVEGEHTDDPAAAKEIAKDHLTEDPDYYRKLRSIEDMHKAEQLGLAFDAPAPAPHPHGGYFIGPRGGKWADAAHTIPWHERKGTTRAAKETPVPPAGTLTRAYLTALGKTLGVILTQDANDLATVAAQAQTAERFVDRLVRDLMYTRGAWHNVADPDEEKKTGSSKRRILAGKLQVALADLRSRAQHWRSQADFQKTAIQSLESAPPEWIRRKIAEEHGGDREEWIAAVIQEMQAERGADMGAAFNRVAKAALAWQEQQIAVGDLPRTALRQFKVGDLTVTLNDDRHKGALPATMSERARNMLRHPEESEEDVAGGLLLAQRALRHRGLSHVWHGEIRVEDEAAAFEFLTPQGQQLKAAASYNIAADHVNVYEMRRSNVGFAHWILHELGHRHWFKVLTAGERAKFVDQFKAVKPVSDYGATQPSEDFAEAFAEYVLDRGRMDRDQIERLRPYLHKSLGAKRDAITRRRFAGFLVSIEHDVGAARHWHNSHDGTSGTTVFRFPYGYIRGTEGTDGDHLDVFLGPLEHARMVYVINQVKAPEFTSFDEQKVMLGFASAAEAKQAYLAHYDNPRFFGSMFAVPTAVFRAKWKAGMFDRGRKRIAKALEQQRYSAVTGAQPVRLGTAVGSMGLSPAGLATGVTAPARPETRHPGHESQRKRKRRAVRRPEEIRRRASLDALDAAQRVPARGAQTIAERPKLKQATAERRADLERRAEVRARCVIALRGRR